MENKSSSTGLAPNIAAGISYIIGFITGLIFYLLEKDDKFVRFHAMQSILLSLGTIAAMIVLGIVGTILGFIPVLGVILAGIFVLLSWLALLAAFVVWLICLIKAFQGAKYKIPYLGDMAEKYA